MEANAFTACFKSFLIMVALSLKIYLTTDFAYLPGSNLTDLDRERIKFN